MVSNRDIMSMLYELAELTVLDEENAQSFKVKAYENARLAIAAHPDEISAYSIAGLIRIKGVGRSIADKIVEYVETGAVSGLDELRARYPPDFFELTKISGLGPKTLKQLRAQLGIENLDDLRRAIDSEALRDLAGFGAAKETKIGKAIERLGLHGKDRRTPISDAMPIALQFVEDLRRIDGVLDAAYCGSLRRLSETIGDIDIVVASRRPELVMDAVSDHRAASEVIVHGDTKTSVLTRSGLQVDVRVVDPEQFGAAMLYFTGSKAHNIVLRRRAIDRGWLLNEYGLFEGETVVARATEQDVYRALDLVEIPPPLRENTGEVEAADARTLGDLVTLDDIAGDLHFHTDRSGDGRSSLREMVQAASDRGYTYVAITDHGEDLAINGSSREQMLGHRRAIEEVQSEFPRIRLLFGCELNIGAGGGLDYDEDFRAEFDWTVASVHSHFDLPVVRQTERVIRAIADPAVSAIGHLTGRYIGRRPGIELDLDVVFDALVAFDTFLEINGALERLDASAEVVRRAVAKGVRVVISTDSHHVSDLARMAYGVANAQRGWVRRSAVVNALGLDEFLATTRRRT